MVSPGFRLRTWNVYVFLAQGRAFPSWLLIYLILHSSDVFNMFLSIYPFVFRCYSKSVTRPAVISHIVSRSRSVSNLLSSNIVTNNLAHASFHTSSSTAIGWSLRSKICAFLILVDIAKMVSSETTNLHANQQCMRVPFAHHCYQYCVFTLQACAHRSDMIRALY